MQGADAHVSDYDIHLTCLNGSWDVADKLQFYSSERWQETANHHHS